MKMINLYSILFIINLFSCSQEQKCNDFKKGVFITSNDTKGTRPYKIIREGELQTEIDNEGVRRYSKIKWISDCSYVLTYDADKMRLNDFQKEVNSVGGITVKVNKIEGNCFYYTSNIKGDDHSQQIDGVMCKE